MSMMNDYEEDLDDFPAENKENPAESTVEASRAESTYKYRYIQQEVESQRRFHLSLTDRRPGASTRS